MALGAPESTGPGKWKWTSGPPKGLGTRTPPGMGMGEPLGTVRSSRNSRDSLRPAGRGQRQRLRTPGAWRHGKADRDDCRHGLDIMVTLLFEDSLPYTRPVIDPGADEEPGRWQGDGTIHRASPAGRLFLHPVGGNRCQF